MESVGKFLSSMTTRGDYGYKYLGDASTGLGASRPVLMLRRVAKPLILLFIALGLLVWVSMSRGVDLTSAVPHGHHAGDHGPGIVHTGPDSPSHENPPGSPESHHEPPPQPPKKPESKPESAPEEPPKQPEPEAPKKTKPPPEHKPETPKPPQRPASERRFVVLVPATSPSPDLCKFLLSAIALGYPSPVIVNWRRDPWEATNWERGKTLSKIPGVMRYLDAVMSNEAHPDDYLQEDDLVLIADGYDIWFQLPPDVLLERYHKINAEADARLREQWKHDTPMPMRQTIIAATQKKCYPPPGSPSDLHCDKLPESTLRDDLYGPETDKMPDGKEDYHNFRPRYINGGTYMGTAGDMRRLFRRVSAKLEDSINGGVRIFSEQGIPGEVLGEQEVWRRWRRDHGGGASEDDDGAVTLMQRDFEYHMGLDYTQEISIATVFEEYDGEIVTLSNQTGIDAYSEERGISPVRLHGVPKDIEAARNPLGDVAEKPPGWEDMPLYADFYTEAVPVMLHHNAHVDDLKERRTRWWDRTWFFPHLRELLALRLTPAALSPLATVKVDSEEGEVTYWAPASDKKWRKPRLMNETAEEPLEELEFQEVCHFPREKKVSEVHWWDEVFRDDKGPL